METKRIFKVLLVEDNRNDVILTKEAFSNNGIECEMNVAKDGVEALDYLKKAKSGSFSKVPDMILLDLNLPKKNGKEVLEELKKDERLKAIPVAILTTSSNASDILDCYNLYANCYVTKSVDMAKFEDSITQLKRFWLKTAELPEV